MNLESDKIRIEYTKPEYLQRIIKIEQDNSDFIGQYNFDEHKSVIDNDNEAHFSIFDKSYNSIIGHIILAGLKNTNESIEFRRIVVSRKGKGFGKDSLKLIKKYCFEDLNIHRIWLDVFEANYNAIKLYESQGFKIEGVLRDSVKRDGKYCSLLIMSLLKSNFETTKGEINYNGRIFIPVLNSDNGLVSLDTVFVYKQNGNIITSDYSGERIIKGQLIGLVNNDGEIDIRYQQVNKDGSLMTGICKSKPEIMNNGKIRLHENWKWTSGDESDGKSILEEL